MLEFDACPAFALRNEFHFDFRDEVGNVLPGSIDLPGEKKTMRRLPREHITVLAFGSVFAHLIPAALREGFDDSILERRFGDRVRLGPPA